MAESTPMEYIVEAGDLIVQTTTGADYILI
jgi:hypothetical protein